MPRETERGRSQSVKPKKGPRRHGAFGKGTDGQVVLQCQKRRKQSNMYFRRDLDGAIKIIDGGGDGTRGGRERLGEIFK